ncbi:hypothetical protein HDU98_000221 [Podochytrium sp. JEL0797]|nr:hypothetical protein HDU98_000221 [Podochytrium sp. JEL0797]
MQTLDTALSALTPLDPIASTPLAQLVREDPMRAATVVLAANKALNTHAEIHSAIRPIQSALQEDEKALQRPHTMPALLTAAEKQSLAFAFVSAPSNLADLKARASIKMTAATSSETSNTSTNKK